MKRPTLFILVVCSLAALASVSTAGARAQLTKPQFIAKADAICASAHRQIVRLAPLAPAARTAKVGDRWLSIDRRALKALKALPPPAADRARVARLIHLTDVGINVGLANLVKAAKSGNASAYRAAGVRFSAMLRAGHAAAAAYGLKACATW